MACCPEDMSGAQENDKIEQEANDFSSNLLMPEDLFCKDSFFRKKPSLKNIRKLAFRYDVSFEACANRYVEQHAEPAIIVFYKDKRFRYFKRNKHFPFYFGVKPKKGLAAPALSLTQKSSLCKKEVLTEECVDSSIWFNTSKNFELPNKAIEEVYVQNEGYSMTLLSFERELIEAS